MSRYLLDTSVVAAPMHPAVSETLRGRITRIEDLSAIASIVLDEMLFGVLRLPAGRRRADLLASIHELISGGTPVLPFDQAAAEWHAAERANLSQIGRTPPFADGQIAAVAAANDLTLCTLNPRDFEPFHGVRVEDWSAAAG
ncbi:PIN domain-containing protein [Botrimarina sp.]|uniref:PIN domain-containing protein n=1 Tax=Botrimarina sp. TaxID=2795802 RepID=UPI0032EE82BD